MDNKTSWSLTESDPILFNQLILDLGIIGINVEELITLDSTIHLEPVYAFIFLFNHSTAVTTAAAVSRTTTATTDDDSIYFSQQVINNACATIAILNATLNIHNNNVQLGHQLDNIREFSLPLDSESRGWIIANSNQLRSIHNAFAKQDSYSLQEDDNDQSSLHNKEDAYHFITYLPIQNTLYELDGLTPAPISHGNIPQASDWTTKAIEVIQNRIATYGEGELRFSVLALTGRYDRLLRDVTRLESELIINPSDDATRNQLNETRTEVERLKEQYQDWDVDLAIRQQNHIGLIHSLLLNMAKDGTLEPQIQVAKEAMRKKVEENRKKGRAGHEMEEE